MMPSSNPEAKKRAYSYLVLLAMAFSCFFILSAQRINMSIAIVDMVNWTAVDLGHKQVCVNNNTNRRIETGTFHWSYQSQCQILACYFYGLAVGHWPAEFLAYKLKPHWLALSGMMFASICNFLTPSSAKTSEYYLMSIQVLKAMGHAVVMPAFSVIIGELVKSDSVVPFMGYASTALPLGAFITVLISGIICEIPAYGWEYIFYISGAMGVGWCIFWTYLVAEYFFPTVLIYGTQPVTKAPTPHSKAPLKDIFTSKHVWAFLYAGTATYWAYSFNLLLLPTYIRRVFQAEIQWNYIVSSAPNLLQAFTFMVTVLSSERLLEKNVIEKVLIRKFCIISGFVIFGTCSVLLTFTKCQRGLAGFLTMISLGFIGLNLAVLAALPGDMSPQFAGLLSAVINTIGPLFGSLLPLMIGILSETEEGIRYWNMPFYASVLIGFSALIIFLGFGSSEVQPWNESGRSKSILSDIELQRAEARDDNQNEPESEKDATDSDPKDDVYPSESGSNDILTENKK